MTYDECQKENFDEKFGDFLNLGGAPKSLPGYSKAQKGAF